MIWEDYPETRDRIATEAADLIIQLYEKRKVAVKEIDKIDLYSKMLFNAPEDFVNSIVEVKLCIHDFYEAIDFEIHDRFATDPANVFVFYEQCAIPTIESIRRSKREDRMYIKEDPYPCLRPRRDLVKKRQEGMAIATLLGKTSTKKAMEAFVKNYREDRNYAGYENYLVYSWKHIRMEFLALACQDNDEDERKKPETEGDVRTKDEPYIRENIILRCKLQWLKATIQQIEKLMPTLRITRMVETHPKDYHAFSPEQKEILDTLARNVQAMGKLINERLY